MTHEKDGFYVLIRGSAGDAFQDMLYQENGIDRRFETQEEAEKAAMQLHEAFAVEDFNTSVHVTRNTYKTIDKLVEFDILTGLYNKKQGDL